MINLDPDPEKRIRARALALSDDMLAAVRADDCRKIVLLLKDGADPDMDGGRPMIEAARHEKYRAARTLWRAGADIGLALFTAERELEAMQRYSNEPLPILVTLKKYKEAFVDATQLEEGRKLDQILENQRDIFRKLDQIQRALDQMAAPSIDKDKPSLKPRRD